MLRLLLKLCLSYFYFSGPFSFMSSNPLWTFLCDRCGYRRLPKEPAESGQSPRSSSQPVYRRSSIPVLGARGIWTGADHAFYHSQLKGHDWTRQRWLGTVLYSLYVVDIFVTYLKYLYYNSSYCLWTTGHARLTEGWVGWGWSPGYDPIGWVGNVICLACRCISHVVFVVGQSV